MTLATLISIANLVMVVLAGILMTGRVFSRPRTIEAFTHEDHLKTLAHLSQTLSELEPRAPDYHEHLKRLLTASLATLQNRIIDRDYALDDEIRRSRQGVSLLILSALLQSVLFFLPA